jgi:hypothetical protein
MLLKDANNGNRMFLLNSRITARVDERNVILRKSCTDKPCSDIGNSIKLSSFITSESSFSYLSSELREVVC